jgi:acid phosphatase (class A)
MKINTLRLIAIPILLLNSLLIAKEAPATTYLDASTLPIKQVIPPPPAAGSDAEKADFSKYTETITNHTPQDVERATREQKDSVFDFSESLGTGFNAANLPKTAELFEEITKDAKVDINVAKRTFQRPRPADAASDDKAKDSDKYSYPSGHSTRAFLWASLLEELFPEQKEALLKIAGRKAWDRVVLGKHYPADVQAGQVYGEFLAKELLKNDAFQKKWQIIKLEIESFKKNSAISSKAT